MIAPPTNTLFLHELEHRLTLRKQARQARAQAARQGHSNALKRRRAQCDAMFGRAG
jgi:hypothetical protein